MTVTKGDCSDRKRVAQQAAWQTLGCVISASYSDLTVRDLFSHAESLEDDVEDVIGVGGARDQVEWTQRIV